MKVVFADAFYFIALLNEADTAHRRAADFTLSFVGTFVTTAWVLAELADAFAATRRRNVIVQLIRQLQAKPTVKIVEPTQDLFARGLELYDRRPDKDWSLTDCISFVVMADEGLTDALTGDHHFGQAGFQALRA